MDPNNHFNTQNSANFPFNQNPNNFQNPNNYQNPNYYQNPNQFSNQHPQNIPSFGFPPNFNQSSSVPNFQPYYGSMPRNPSQTPPFNGYVTMANANFPSGGVPEFPEFSTQLTIGGMIVSNEVAPNSEDSTPKSRKTQQPAWNTEQNLVLISGWIKFGTSSVVGRNQKGETYWGKIAEYCNEHCSFDPPRDGPACRNRFNYMNKVLGKWIGAYDGAKRMQGSGWSENDVLAKAQELYACGKNVRFTLMEEWHALRDQPRYVSQVGGNIGSGKRRNKISEDNAPRSRKYLNRDHAAANQRLIDDYFANEPTYGDAMFRRRYRMKKNVFLRIVGDLSSSDNYFTQRVDAANKEGISPLAKCTTAMRMLAYGVAADAVDEYIKIGGTTALECLRRFCKGIIRLYEQVYLRAPTQDDLQRILHVSEMRGFPGMIGSIDCMHWEWKNCPKAWEGQFTRGDKGTTTVILEAVASHDLWIWHAFFGCPGTLNDINVLDRSPVFDDVEQGKAPSVNFFVNQRPYNMAYYLADGIYPSYPTFVKSIRLPQSEPDKLFAKFQEGCRKDIERAFGVLQARFKIIREPARLWDIADLGIIMRSCIILHNMIVEDERDSYSQRWTDFEQSEESGSSAPQPYSTEVLPAFANHVRARSEFRDPNVHQELQADLVKHIWTKFGMFRD
ncbi:uncharacterized protein LOC131620313 [Vicia villosa]|uniref:uncharacterized protein LOC131594136 n=1 Tax=Vicia villosa TaxID=3911 RepID=UPI00273B86BD|nr:uncharacterized protein LOC131594136 [Vicia villosa]XP_058747329.1 uncharacterized protein LOC131620313 [Vicia villosa]